jgi:biotin/methionine sulfoxide reductase
MNPPAATRKIRNMAHWGAFTAEVEGDRLVSVAALAGDRNPSAMIHTIPGAVHHASRIAQPMVRKSFLERREHSDRRLRGAEPFVALAWDEALDLVAAELRRVKEQHGNDAIYQGSGWASPGKFHSAKALMSRFVNLFGGSVEPVTNYSFGAASVIVPHVVGSMDPVIGAVTAWPVIAEHTKLFVSFGGLAPKNAQVNSGGLASHDLQDALATLSDVDFVYLGPSRADVPEGLRAEHMMVRPGTDMAVMLGLAHTLFAEGLHDQAFLDRYTTGFARFLPYLTGASDGQPKDAAWAGAIAGIDSEAIRALARRMAGTRTMISASWSVQRADHGEQPYWMVVVLAAMLGQIGLPGGGFGFGYGAINGIGRTRKALSSPSLPVEKNPVSVTVPVARISDALLNPGAEYDFNGQRRAYPDIRLMYWCGGNAFHQQQQINKLLEGWTRPETIIVHEPWWTPTAKRADIVLPVTTIVERNDIAASSFDSSWAAMQQAIPPVGQARNEYDIFAELAGRLGFRDAYTEGRDEMGWLRAMYEAAREKAAKGGDALPDFDAFWAAGRVDMPAGKPPVLFDKFRADPEANPLKTPSGRIEIFSEKIDGFGYDDCPGHPVWFEPVEWLGGGNAATYPLHMISNQPRTRLHSQMDNGPVSGAGKVQGREAVRMNPADAARRGIQDGELVRIHNARGACLAGAILTDALSPGVIELSTGAWFDPEQPGQPGSLDKHGNPNMLTLDKGTSKLAQCSIAQTALVQVERWTGPVPPVTAFQPPEIVAREAAGKGQ